jgi:cytidylate kinase
LGYIYLNTGATFRAVALKARRKGVDIADPVAAARVAREAEIGFGGEEHERVLLDGEDVTSAIGSQEISSASSKISAHPEVRRCLTELWRTIGRGGGVVLEGRDIGTIVFPDADLKIFLVAQPIVRAERRYRELAERSRTSLEQVELEILRRDEADSSRRHAPLARAADAVEVDTSELDIGQMVDYLEKLARARIEAGDGSDSG